MNSPGAWYLSTSDHTCEIWVPPTRERCLVRVYGVDRQSKGMRGICQVGAVVEIQWTAGGYVSNRTKVSSNVAVDVNAPRV